MACCEKCGSETNSRGRATWRTTEEGNSVGEHATNIHKCDNCGEVYYASGRSVKVMCNEKDIIRYGKVVKIDSRGGKVLV